MPLERYEMSSEDLDLATKREQEQRLEELRLSEFYLAEAQRLAHIGSWSFTADGTREYWSAEWFDILGLDPAQGVPPIPEYLKIVHPDDREFVKSEIERMITKGEGCDAKYRIIHPQRGVRWIRGVGMPIFENGVLTRFAGTSIDITEEEKLTQELNRSQAYLAEAQSLSHTGSFGWVVSTGEIFWSQETFRIFEYDPATKPTVELVLQRTHPEDKDFVRQVIDRSAREGNDFDLEHRLLMPDQRIKYLHIIAHRRTDNSENLEFIGAVRDVTAAKIAQGNSKRTKQSSGS